MLTGAEYSKPSLVPAGVRDHKYSRLKSAQEHTTIPLLRPHRGTEEVAHLVKCLQAVGHQFITRTYTLKKKSKQGGEVVVMCDSSSGDKDTEVTWGLSAIVG